MLTLNSIMLGSTQPRVLAKFYQEVLERVPDMREGEWSGWQVGKIFFSVGEHTEARGKNKSPERVIFNFEANNVQTEFARLKEIEGIEVIKEPYDAGGMTIATFSDPDGNFFQLNSPWEAESA